MRFAPRVGDSLRCRRASRGCRGRKLVLPERRAVAYTRALARRPARLLHVAAAAAAPPPPPANASSLQLPPSAPPSPLAPKANPATDDQPPRSLSPATDCNSSPRDALAAELYS
ncbi:Hypothetical predicted protein [Marmota monax]|uniref:Uncharacterized protein n=1 Tax=Marmota monax TaxID=9995 RepID=A0A5E4CCV1_MARMO|nr:Hypothetical predicted protein [Marmota monax]